MADNQTKKALVVYYSRTGAAAKVAAGLQKQLGCPADKVSYEKEVGPGFIRACLEAVFRKTCAIKGDASDAREFSRVIVVTPVWASGLSTPIRSYLKKHAESIASYSLVSVMASNGDPEKDAAAAAGKKPERAAVFLTEHVKKGDIDYASLAMLAE